MRTLDILIPSYNRAKILGHTLDSIANTVLDRYEYDIEVNVRLGILDTDPHNALMEIERVYQQAGMEVDYICYYDNIGKARCMNDMFKNLNKPEWVITLDNDMVFLQTWIHIVDAAIRVRELVSWDYVGFGGQGHFIHLPANITETTTFAYSLAPDRKYYLSMPYGIGGGMLLFHQQFLRHWTWQNNGNGVYLGDDAHLSATIQNKFVMYHDSPWIIHDPYGHMYPEYNLYYKRKAEHILSDDNVYQKGWDQ